MNSQFDLMIVPSLSGYRDRETNELIITHSYLHELLEKYQDWQDLKILMSLSESFWYDILTRAFMRSSQIKTNSMNRIEDL